MFSCDGKGKSHPSEKTVMEQKVNSGTLRVPWDRGHLTTSFAHDVRLQAVTNVSSFGCCISRSCSATSCGALTGAVLGAVFPQAACRFGHLPVVTAWFRTPCDVATWRCVAVRVETHCDVYQRAWDNRANRVAIGYNQIINSVSRLVVLRLVALVSRLESLVKSHDGDAIMPPYGRKEKQSGLLCRRVTWDERRHDTIRRWTDDIRQWDRKKITKNKKMNDSSIKL